MNRCKQIADNLQKMKNPYFNGSITILKYTMNNLKIIDGKDRIKAICEVKLNNPSFNMGLQCNVYS